jgi:hypothetical protein
VGIIERMSPDRSRRLAKGWEDRYRKELAFLLN